MKDFNFILKKVKDFKRNAGVKTIFGAGLVGFGLYLVASNVYDFGFAEATEDFGNELKDMVTELQKD